MAAGRTVRVLVASNVPLLRQALTRLTSDADELTCAAAVPLGPEALAAASGADAAIVVTDGLLDFGLHLAHRLATLPEAPHVLLVGARPEADYGERALRAGCRGYVELHAEPETIVGAVRAVAAGRPWIRPETAAALVTASGGDLSKVMPFGLASLTPRERDVVDAMGEGLEGAPLLEALGVSRKTLETHRRIARLKLGFDTVDDLAAYARHLAAGTRVGAWT